MAGAGTGLVDHQDEGVLIAVGADFDDLLGVTRGRALVPKFLARARPVDCFAQLEGAAQRLGVHVGEHERLTGGGIHCECGDESISIEFWRKTGAFLDIGFGATGRKGVRRIHAQHFAGMMAGVEFGLLVSKFALAQWWFFA